MGDIAQLYTAVRYITHRERFSLTELTLDPNTQPLGHQDQSAGALETKTNVYLSTIHSPRAQDGTTF